jgi:hypothetical protein
MARLACVGTVLAAFLAAGCQTHPVQTGSTLPTPNFSGPAVAQAAPPKPIYIAPQQVAKAPPKAVAKVPGSWVPASNAERRNWDWIVVHHSAGEVGGANSFAKYHKSKGWDELGYHFVIGNGSESGDGEIEVGPRWSAQKHGAHAKTADNKYNEHGIGICLVGNFDVSRPTAKQMAALTKLVAYLADQHRVSQANIIGHKMTGKSTDCPGTNMDIAQVRAAVGRARVALAEETTEGSEPSAAIDPNVELMQSAGAPVAAVDGSASFAASATR